MSDDRDLQRDVTSTILGSIGDHGFVLAGSGAIREHGIVDRLTHDVDLFTDQFDPERFSDAIESATAALQGAGYTVVEQHRDALFAHLDITTPDGRTTDVDFGYDWRGSQPANLQVGPVLSADDAVASKVGAVYTRGEPRDFIDLDAIRSSGRYTDARLLDLVADRDDGFDRSMFADQLERVRRYEADRFEDYGYDQAQADRIRDRATSWAATLRGDVPSMTSSTAAGLAQRHIADAGEPRIAENTAADDVARMAADLQASRAAQQRTTQVAAAAAAERAEQVRRQQEAAQRQRQQEQQRRGIAP